MTGLRLVVDNDLPARDVAGLRLLEQVTRTRLLIETLSGPSRGELDVDVAEIRRLTLRVIARLADGRNQ